MIAFLATIWKGVFFVVNGIRDGAAWCRDHAKAALWIALAAAILIVILFARCAVSRGRDIESLKKQVASAEERSQVKSAGVPVADPATVEQLKAEIETLKRENAAFAEARDDNLARLKEAGVEIKKLRTVIVARGSTGKLPAGGRSARAGGTAPGPSIPDLSVPPAPHRPLFAEGDQGRIDVALSVDRTDKRNLVITGAATALRTDPAPEEVLLSGKLDELIVKVDPEVIAGPTVTVTKTRWTPVWIALGTGVALGFCAANSHHCGIGK